MKTKDWLQKWKLFRNVEEKLHSDQIIAFLFSSYKNYNGRFRKILVFQNCIQTYITIAYKNLDWLGVASSH